MMTGLEKNGKRQRRIKTNTLVYPLTAWDTEATVSPQMCTYCSVKIEVLGKEQLELM